MRFIFRVYTSPLQWMKRDEYTMHITAGGRKCLLQESPRLNSFMQSVSLLFLFLPSPLVCVYRVVCYINLELDG